MPAADQQKTNIVLNPEETEEMEEFGITRVAVDYFHCGEFRYNNLKDAVSQAKRRQKLT